MSKLNVDQKSVLELLSDKRADFLIPDYQRPYAWDEDQCQTLWDDLFLFAFPDNDYEKFDDNEEYFLGSIVTFKNDQGKLEIIDGQQRLTTLMLILRAFYDKFEMMNDTNSKKTRDMIEKCLWMTNTFETADKDRLKIDSEVATDNDKEEFLRLLKTGVVPSKSCSQYVLNYKFFQKKLEEFLQSQPSYFAYLPARILKNCILLPIEAESQDTALRIFSTLNDRGLPLSDADIFKAQFYKYYSDKNEKDEFVQRWKKLEEFSSDIFKPSGSNTPMDELFTRYMYFLRALEGNKRNTTEALRKFYERNKYQYLKKDETIDDLESLAGFWNNVAKQNTESFSKSALKKLYVLHYSPNSMWEYILSVYFLHKRDANGKLVESELDDFLDRLIAFTFTYAITNSGVNALRTPLFDEMVNIIQGIEVTFNKYRFQEGAVRNALEHYKFTNSRRVTRSIITWYAFTFKNQIMPKLNECFDIEHIYAKKRQGMESDSVSNSTLESLGNKVLLEQTINVRASDYRFEDKKKIYTGELRRGSNNEPSKIAELKEIVEMSQFEEGEILERNKKIIDSFINYLKEENLLQQ